MVEIRGWKGAILIKDDDGVEMHSVGPLMWNDVWIEGSTFSEIWKYGEYDLSKAHSVV